MSPRSEAGLFAPADAEDPAHPMHLLCRELAFDDPLTGARRVFRSRRSVLEPAADGTTDTPAPHQT